MPDDASIRSLPDVVPDTSPDALAEHIARARQMRAEAIVGLLKRLIGRRPRPNRFSTRAGGLAVSR